MPATPTAVRQQTEVGEGLAVGCLVAGVSAIGPSGALDAALHHALDGWPWAARYPSIRATPLVEILQRSSSRRGPRVAQWVRSSGVFVPQLRDDAWDLPAACERVEEESGVPARRWIEVAAVFLSGLDDAAVWRTPMPDPLADDEAP